MLVVTATLLCVAMTALNLVLSLGVVRRLRDHNDRLTALEKAESRPDPMIGPGTRPAAFAATTVDAEPITEAGLAGGGLVGFFSPTCGSCEEWLPQFAAAADALPGGPRQALAVVVAETETEAADMVARLRDVAMVVVERDGGPLSIAFKISGYPAMCRLNDDGSVATFKPADVVTLPVVA